MYTLYFFFLFFLIKLFFDFFTINTVYFLPSVCGYVTIILKVGSLENGVSEVLLSQI
jgi:hypothetical protein